jgi:hypothetical protein
MAEARPFASLSSGLLARKGAAKPAMRPQAFGQIGASLDDLGWNDMGDAEPAEAPEHVPSSIAALTPSPRLASEPLAVHDQRRQLADSFEIEEEAAEEAGEPEILEEFEAEPEQQPEILQEFEAEPEQQPAILQEFEAEPEQPPEPAQAPVQAAVETRPAPVQAEVVEMPRRRAMAAREKSAFTLRLDPDRHFRLRLACAVTGRSAQQIVTGALDEMLKSLPEIDALAGRMPQARARS